MNVKSGKEPVDEPLDIGPRYRIVLAATAARCSRAGRPFFSDRWGMDEDEIAMYGRLRTIARYGLVAANSESYEFLDHNVHYIKAASHAALGLSRHASRGPELVICIICEKEHGSTLREELNTKARIIFAQHCERQE